MQCTTRRIYHPDFGHALLALSLLLLAVGVAGCEKAKEKVKQKAKQKARDEANKAVDKTIDKAEMGVMAAEDKVRERLSAAEREKFKAKMKEKAEQADKKIAELKVKMKKADKKAREKMKPTLEKLNQKRKKLSQEMNELSDTSAEKWKEGKAKVTKLVDGLEGTLDRALEKAGDAAMSPQ